MISEGSVSRSLYSYMTYSAHVILLSQIVLDVQEYVNIHVTRWWKS